MLRRNRGVLLFDAMCCAAAGPLECPSLLPRDVSHRLANASLFDGPPDKPADLIAVAAGGKDRWDLDGIDAYLVCRYEGTQETLVLRAKDAKTCEAGGTPFRAGCR